jgi:hypothetical protein
MRNTFKTFVVKGGRMLFGRLGWHKWEDNIVMHLKRNKVWTNYRVACGKGLPSPRIQGNLSIVEL